MGLRLTTGWTSPSLFSSSEAETSEEETMDKDTLLRSPLEQKTETGTAPSCSAKVPTGGVATGHKRKTEGGPTPVAPLRHLERKNASVDTRLALLLNKKKKKTCLVLSLLKDNHIKHLHGPRSIGSVVSYLQYHPVGKSKSKG